MVQMLSRRDRVRAETTAEIKQTARKILVEQGPEAVTLRAIAREMGMTAPALYRYFGSHEELIQHVVGDIFTEIGAGIAAAIDSAGDGMTEKMVAACREFRRWALNHKDEFALLFGVPVPGLDDGRFDIAEQCALEFAGTFYVLFLELWNATRFPVPADADIDPVLRRQLGRFGEKLGTNAPDGAILVFLRCWTLLYGALSMEVFGHLGFALDDPAPMFELTLGDLAGLVGLEYPLPAA